MTIRKGIILAGGSAPPSFDYRCFKAIVTSVYEADDLSAVGVDALGIRDIVIITTPRPDQFGRSLFGWP